MARRKKPTKKEVHAAPGCRPFVQGYWHRAENRPKTPPDKYEGQREAAWISEWHRGWDSRVAWEQTDIGKMR